MHEVTKYYLNKSGSEMLADCNGGPMGVVINMTGPENAAKRALFQVKRQLAGITGGAIAAAQKPEPFVLSIDGQGLLAPDGSIVNLSGPNAAAARELYVALANMPDEDLLDKAFDELVKEGHACGIPEDESNSTSKVHLIRIDKDLADKTLEELQEIYIGEGLPTYEDPADGENLEDESDEIQLSVFISLARERKCKADIAAAQQAERDAQAAETAARERRDGAAVVVAATDIGPAVAELAEKTIEELAAIIADEGLSEYTGPIKKEDDSLFIAEIIIDARESQKLAEADDRRAHTARNEQPKKAAPDPKAKKAKKTT